MIVALLSILSAGADEPPRELTPPISEVRHPRYQDANGVPLHWRDVRRLSRGSDAHRQVQSRRLGRNVLRVLFVGASTAEWWGVSRLARDENLWALPLGVQAGSTTAVATLLFTATPRYVQEDRALLLKGANAVLVPRR